MPRLAYFWHCEFARVVAPAPPSDYQRFTEPVEPAAKSTLESRPHRARNETQASPFKPEKFRVSGTRPRACDHRDRRDSRLSLLILVDPGKRGTCDRPSLSLPTDARRVLAYIEAICAA